MKEEDKVEFKEDREEKDNKAESVQAVREYVAFISYRHTEPDKKVAKKVHYMIEHYVIPKELRGADGKKHLGKVFRDEEELPVSSNLTESIETALDHSKFLVVICTPNLPESIWCEREIAYFIEKHGRDHVVGILVDGTPDQSFPKLLTQVREFNEKGEEAIREVEPLAANLTDVDHRYKEGRLRKEAVRLYAALLGCPFDSLWQRERRQKMRKLVALMALVMTIALAFSASIYLKNREISARNQQIEEQNARIQSQNEEIKTQYVEIQDKNADLRRSEAEALIRSGELLYEKGDTRGAIRNARLAVSTKEGRESVGAEAEFLLYRAMGAGQNANVLRTVGVIEQDEDVECMALSKDGSRVYTLGSRGYVRCFSTQDDQQVWLGDSLARGYYYDVTIKHRLRILEEEELLLCCNEGCVTALNLEDGSLVWTHTLGKNGSPDFASLSEDGKTLAVMDKEGDIIRGTVYWLRFLDVKNGEVCTEMDITGLFPEKAELTSLGDLVGAFSEDGRYFACMIYEGRYSVLGRMGYVLLVDLEEQTAKILLTEDYSTVSAYPFVIGMLLHAENRCVIALHYRPDEGGVSMEQIFFDGKVGEHSLVPLPLPERGMTSAYATTFVPGENNALLASCLSMNLLYRVDNGLLVNSSQTAAESVLKRSWINQENFARSDLAADGNHYAWYGAAGYTLSPFSEKKHIVLLEITDGYATNDGGYGYHMDENVVQVILCDDNPRRLYVQKQAKDPEVKVPDWTKELVGTATYDLRLRKVSEDTLVVIQNLKGSMQNLTESMQNLTESMQDPAESMQDPAEPEKVARLIFVDVAADAIKKTVDVNLEDLGTYSSIYQLENATYWADEKHFTYERSQKLYVYDLETKESTLLMEDAADRLIDRKSCKLGNGEVLQAYLTYKKGAEYGEPGGRATWQIGEGEAKEALAPEGEAWGGSVLTYSGEHLFAGANGYLVIGACEGEETRRSKFVAIDVGSGAGYELADQRKEEAEGTVILGEKKPLFAVLDADGVLRVYDIAAQALKQEIKLLEGQVIADVSFAMDDGVLVVYSYDGWLFVLDVDTGKELFAGEMGEASSSSVAKTLTCYNDPAGNRLLVTVTGENGLGLDTATWKQTMILYDEVDAFFGKENVTYKANRESALPDNSTDLILRHVPLTLEGLIREADALGDRAEVTSPGSTIALKE